MAVVTECHIGLSDQQVEDENFYQELCLSVASFCYLGISETAP